LVAVCVVALSRGPLSCAVEHPHLQQGGLSRACAFRPHMPGTWAGIEAASMGSQKRRGNVLHLLSAFFFHHGINLALELLLSLLFLHPLLDLPVCEFLPRPVQEHPQVTGDSEADCDTKADLCPVECFRHREHRIDRHDLITNRKAPMPVGAWECS